MNKIKASVAVIGYQKEDSGMYPHLLDFLQNLRASFDEVIYIDDDDRGEHLYLVEYYIRTALSALGVSKHIVIEKIDSKQIDASGTCENKTLSVWFIFYLIKKMFLYAVKQLRLIWKIRNLTFIHNKKIIIAIDHTAPYFAVKYSKGCPIIFWSFDVLAEDAPWRIQNGLLEKLITSGTALHADVLMIQDANRKNLLEKSVDKVFDKTLYLPVALNDSEFCRFAAAKRASKDYFDIVKIIQSGLLSEIRLTVELIDEYQNWPSSMELFLHGKLCGNAVNEKLEAVVRKAVVTSEFYDNAELSCFLDNFDIGFVGYGESDSNFQFNENASAQLVGFLRLGIPVIVCGSQNLNAFITDNQVGIAVTSLKHLESNIRQLIDNYKLYSCSARKLYEAKYNLASIFESYLIPSISGMI